MKEIIYIQAGQFANYVGTHFWNTQESYFTYEEGEESDVVHDVSFREGLTQTGESTFCPRLLLFDRKAHFGPLSSASGLYGSETGGEEEAAAPWSGNVVEYRQEPIPESDYHKTLNAEEGEQENLHAGTGEHSHAADTQKGNVRYWSDFSRVDFHPRSLQKLPDLPEWKSSAGDWNLGKEIFKQHDKDTSLMEESFRLFIEECDNLQGIQVINDTPAYGGFTDAFLTAFRDELPKIPCLSVPLLSHILPGTLEADEERGMARVINDALCLRSLDTLATMSIPIQAPETWTTGEWLHGIDLNRNSLYQTSAIVSAHLESATLPLRSKGSTDDLTSACEMLNREGETRFAQLSGVFPLHSPVQPDRDFVRRMYDFSAFPGSGGAVPHAEHEILDYAKIYVARGFSASDRRTFDKWCEPHRPVPYNIYAPGYPLPSSFPPFLTSPPPPPHPHTASHHPSTPPHVHAPTVRVLSSLCTTPHTARMFGAYAQAVEECAARRPGVLETMGVERDEAKELKDVLWALRDGYAGAEGVVEEPELGEDEQ